MLRRQRLRAELKLEWRNSKSKSGDAARADFFGSQAEDGRSPDAEHAQIDVNLAAMVRFMLRHRAEPLPGGDVASAWCLTFLLQVVVRQLRKDLDGFCMEPVEQSQNLVQGAAKFL